VLAVRPIRVLRTSSRGRLPSPGLQTGTRAQTFASLSRVGHAPLLDSSALSRRAPKMPGRNPYRWRFLSASRPNVLFLEMWSLLVAVGKSLEGQCGVAHIGG